MDNFPYKAESHNDHEDRWCIVSSPHEDTLCIACLIEYLEDQSLTGVHKKFILSLLKSILMENDEVLQLFHDHPQVCQLIIDIMTDYYTDPSLITESIPICVQLMDALQSEELYLYLLEKFWCQVQINSDIIPFVVALLGRLAVISSAYALTLLLSQERLLLFLLEQCCNSPEDEALECSLLFLLFHLFDTDVLPVVPAQVLPFVAQCLVRWMTSVQSEDSQINTVALLKRILQTNCCLGDDDRDSWTALLSGLKRCFVSRKEVLVTAATQCLIIIASAPDRPNALRLIQESDLPEFLFEALHTMNAKQLENVFKCLCLLAEQDLFFKRCHSVYGLESVLRSLDVALKTRNLAVLVNGFTLLSTILLRQPSSIPIYVNKSTEELTMSVISKGVGSHAVQVVLLALTAARALFRDVRMATRQPAESVQTVVQAALTTMDRAVWRGDASVLLSTLKITEFQVLDTSLALLTSCFVLHDEQSRPTAYEMVIEQCRDKIIPYFSNHFTCCDESILRILFNFLNTLYDTDGPNTQHMSETAVTSGLIFNVLRQKTILRSDLELLSLTNNFLVHTFHVLLKENLSVSQCQSLPDDLKSGLKQLSLQNSIEESVEKLEENAASALCMVAYFSCLNDSQIFPPSETLRGLEELNSKGILNCTPTQPLITRFVVYLLAWANGHSDRETDSPPDCEKDHASLDSVEKVILQQALVLPVELWATPCPQVFVWLFQTSQRARGLGTTLLEHWLLHTKGIVPIEGNDPHSHLICDLFFSQHFRAVLINLMTSKSEEISVLSRKLTTTLIRIKMGKIDEQTANLIHSLNGEIMSQLQNLFMESCQPHSHCVNNFLQTIIAVTQHPMYESSDFEWARCMRMIHHVVHYIGTLDNEDSEILYNGLTSLISLSRKLDTEQVRTVVPILVQNSSFMRQLEKCLQSDELRTSSAALSVAAWISFSSSKCQIETPINVSTDLILKTITTCSRETIVAALKGLYLSLDVTSHSGICLLTFHRSPSFYQPQSLYTAQELRLLVCYVQQYICSEDKEIQSLATQSYLQLIVYSNEIDSELGDHFTCHPWNPQLLQFLVMQTLSSGLELHVAELLLQIWNAEDDSGGHEEVAKQILESVLVTDINDENKGILHNLFQKAKKQSQHNDLAEQVKIKFAAFENSLSLSQNTQTSA